jgi:hypothetical protein
VSDTKRIYFDGAGVDAPAGATVIDALEGVKPNEAAAVRAGEKVITDSRGLPTEPSTPIYGGAIFRLIRARSRDNEEHSEI